MNRLALTLLLAFAACGPSYSLSLTQLSLPPEPAHQDHGTLTITEGTIVRATLTLEDDGRSIDDVRYDDLRLESDDPTRLSILPTANERSVVLVAKGSGATAIRARYGDRVVRGLTVQIAAQARR